MRRALFWIFLAAAGTFPAIALRLLGAHPDHAAKRVVWETGSLSGPQASLIFGLGILAGAVLVSWAAELMQFDISRNLSIALIALLAVLPEYTVDIYLSWTAATLPENAPLALANMTGANRLLIGLGWPLIVWAYFFARRRKLVRLEKSHWGEMFFLAVATVYSFLLPIKGSLTLIDSVVFLAIFVLYVRYTMRQTVVEPELEGPAEAIGRLPVWSRRGMTALLFLIAGGALFASAEPFAEGLKLAGREWGISDFLLIQWLAPLASESPEFLIALIFALKGKANSGLGALVSSKVNQWTLLVSMVPIAYGLSLLVHGLPLSPMPLDGRQLGELLLTSAQSYFAIVVVINRKFTLAEAAWMAGLFLGQWGLSVGIEEWAPAESHAVLFAWEKGAFSAVYLLLGTIWLAGHRADLRRMYRQIRSVKR